MKRREQKPKQINRNNLHRKRNRNERITEIRRKQERQHKQDSREVEE